MKRKNEPVAAQKEQEQKRKGDDQNICKENKLHLAFFSMVINFAVEVKSERVKTALNAACRFLDVWTRATFWTLSLSGKCCEGVNSLIQQMIVIQKFKIKNNYIGSGTLHFLR